MNAKLRTAIGEHEGSVLVQHLREHPGLEPLALVLQVITAIDEDILFAAVPMEITIQNHLTLSRQSGRRKSEHT